MKTDRLCSATRLSRQLPALLVACAALVLIGATSHVTAHPDAAAIRARMRFLASDALEGRDTGTRGYDTAAAYVASQFEGLGLDPGGADGSWYQPVHLLHTRLKAGQASASVNERALIQGRDLLMVPPPVADLHIHGGIILAGFGLDVADVGLHDFDGVDVRGKFVAVLAGAPASLPSEERAYFSNLQGKMETARAKGAIGLLLLRTPPQEAAWERYVRQNAVGAFYRVDGDRPPTDGQALPMAFLNRSGSDAILAASGRSLNDVVEAAATRPIVSDLGVEMAFDESIDVERVSSPNILARIAGADAALKNEVVVYTAHLDHLGMTAAEGGDSVNHGAIDNASGVAEVIEIARLWRDVRPRPARSALFAIVTGEERGLLGSAVLADDPPVPRSQIAANINLDNFLILYPLRDVVALGGDHSTLGRTVRAEASRLGLEVIPDPRPEQSLFIRNDEFSFVLRGVPSVTIANGVRSADPSVDVPELWTKWFATIYHTPKDTMAQAFNWHAAEQYVSLNLGIGRRVASERARPTWNPGDFFGQRFTRR